MTTTEARAKRETEIVVAQRNRAMTDRTTLLRALKNIAARAGNLSDKILTEKTGANDAVQRGIILTDMRRIAKEAIAAVTVQPEVEEI